VEVVPERIGAESEGNRAGSIDNRFATQFSTTGGRFPGLETAAQEVAALSGETPDATASTAVDRGVDPEKTLQNSLFFIHSGVVEGIERASGRCYARLFLTTAGRQKENGWSGLQNRLLTTSGTRSPFDYGGA
jgi:hypothetical protein